MKSNDLKKGAVVFLKGTNWRATIEDNLRGNIRMATVEGIYTEMGSIYVWDIDRAADGERIELTAKQAKDRDTVSAFGF
jgi:hypothetical protein